MACYSTGYKVVCSKVCPLHMHRNITKEELIKAYPDRFEGIGHFPGTYHMTICSDAKPVVHAPRKCPIAMQPLVREKLDEFLEQGIIIPVEEPTEWVSSLAICLPGVGK